MFQGKVQNHSLRVTRSEDKWGPLHLPGFENRPADSLFNYRSVHVQLETAYVPFFYKNGKSAIFKRQMKRA